jgi:hypothetical protein
MSQEEKQRNQERIEDIRISARCIHKSCVKIELFCFAIFVMVVMITIKVVLL